MSKASTGFWPSFARRLRVKLLAIAPIIGAAIVLTLLFSAALVALYPILPDSVQELLRDIQSGDLSAIQASLTALFDGLGIGKPIAYLIVQVAQVLFAPIPGQAVGLLGGILFGFWPGLLLSMIGLTIGSAIAIGIGRLLGERIVRRLVSKSVLDKFDYLITEGGIWNFFMLFLLPALPDDAICFIAGLTRLRIWKLILACVIGRLPGIAVLLFFGSSIGGDMAVANVVFAIGIVIAVVLWLYSDEIEAYFARRVKGARAETRE